MTDTGPIRVFLIDDDDDVRAGIRDLLWIEQSIDVVGEASNGEQAIELIAQTTPDVAVVDVRLQGGMSGIELCRDIRSRHSDTACIMLTGFGDDDALFASIMAGAAGYALKQIRGGGLISAIQRVAAGDKVFDDSLAAGLLDWLRDPPADDLTYSQLAPAERQVLSLIADGLTNRQIAEAMEIPESTVQDHVARLLDKLGTRRLA